jgi:hypothetical protein
VVEDSNRGFPSRDLRGLDEQQQKRTEGQQEVAQQAYLPGQAAISADEGVVQLGEKDQPDRKSDRDSNGPVEPRGAERVHHRSDNR